jgi:hypothetical protein
MLLAYEKIYVTCHVITSHALRPQVTPVRDIYKKLCKL